MCTMNAGELINSLNEIMVNATKGKQTAASVARSLQLQATELRKQADALVLLARQLTGNENARQPIESKPVKKVEQTKQKKTKIQRKPLTEEQKAYRRELCAKMREKKLQKTLVEKFAETKIN